jgi:hypothetical protein
MEITYAFPINGFGEGGYIWNPFAPTSGFALPDDRDGLTGHVNPHGIPRNDTMCGHT